MSDAREPAAALAELRGAYDRTGSRWKAGPASVYERLADRLVDGLPEPLQGRLALDAGAGTGAASRALQARGASVVALDLSHPMLRADAARRPPAVVGDIHRLPLRPGSVDAAVAAFVLSHVPAPAAALGELRRVTRPGGWVAASAFVTGHRHPVKAAVDEIAVRFGYRPPLWYGQFKEAYEPRVGTPAALREVAAAAGLPDATIIETLVDLDDLSPARLVAWRLDMPHLGGFVADLDPPTRRRLAAAAEEVLGSGPPPELPVLYLHAAVP